MPRYVKILRLATFCWHTIITNNLQCGAGTVVDLGANKGKFIAELCSRFPLRGLAVEPVRKWYDAILIGERINKLQCAVGGRTGVTKVYVSKNDDASNIVGLSQSDQIAEEVVPIRTLESILQDVSDLKLLKIDIEGAEIALFDSTNDVTLRSIPQITVEFHDFCGLTPVDDIIRITQRLTSLGFSCIKFSYRDYSNVLFVNNQYLKLSSFHIAYLRHVYRHLLRGFWFFRRHLAGQAKSLRW